MPRFHHVFAADLLQRWRRCRSGIAAMEFALIGPVMILMFLGVVESADALARSRQVNLAVNTLADLAAQETNLLTADADDLFDGIEQIVDDGGAPMVIRLISVVADEDGDPVVHWSRDNSGAAPYAPGAAYDGLPASTLLDSGASIIVGEIDYQYSSKLMRVVTPPISFHGTATRWPRRSIKVQLCVSENNCTY